MNPSLLPSFLRRSHSLHLLLVAALACALPAGLFAQGKAAPRSISEKVGEAFQKLKPLQESKNYDGMIALLDGLIPTVDPTSYDMALILDMKAKLYGQKEQFDRAITSWESMIQIAEPKEYFDKKMMLETRLYLAQFCYQVGVNSKVPAIQQQYVNKSADYFKRWMADTPKPPAEILMFYASILYNQAVADPKKVNMGLLKQSQKQVEDGLVGSAHPKEGLYVLLLAILQQQNDAVRSAEVLEQLVKLYPAKKDYWPSLWATYLNMANEATVSDNKNEGRARENYIRAINTMERAQAVGLMKSTKDNLTLVNLYLTAGQFGRATDLLYAGLKNGSIESDPKNWQTLGYFYQQGNEEQKAIAALTEASALFPKTGQFELQIGQIFLGMERTKDAYAHFKVALKRGGLDKPHSVFQALAYAAFELEEFDEALSACNEAEKFAEGKKDTQLPRLKGAIEAAIKEREYARAEAAKEAAKKLL